MKKIKKFLTALVVSVVITSAFSLSSCREDNYSLPEETVPMKLESVAVYNGINQAKGTVSVLNHRDTIGLFLPDYKYEYPFLYTTRGDYGWEVSTPVSLGSQPTLLWAFYPYRQSEHGELSEKRVFIEHASQTDYMYGYARETVSRSNPHADILMKHALALLRLRFVRGAFDREGKISRIAVRNGEGSNHLHGSGWMHLEDGMIATDYYDCEPAVLEGDALPFGFIPQDNAGEQYIDILVMPLDNVLQQGDVLFEFEIDGWVYALPLPAGTIWESGMSYTYLMEMLSRTQGQGLKRGTASTPAEIRVVLTETKER